MAAPSGRGTANQDCRPHLILTIKGKGGLIATGQVDGCPLKFLIDTGAAVTLVSIEMFQKFPNKTDLQPSVYTICGADGKHLNVLGQGTMEITLGPLRVMHNVIVADIQATAILGIDFLSKHDCKLDISAQKLIIDSERVNLWQEGGEAQCCKVSIKDDVTIPAQTENNRIIHRRGSEGTSTMVEVGSCFA